MIEADVVFFGAAMGGEVWGRVCGAVGPFGQGAGVHLVVRGRVDHPALWWGRGPEGLVLPGTVAARAIERMVERAGPAGVVGKIRGGLRRR